jgi:hypothetical protein
MTQLKTQSGISRRSFIASTAAVGAATALAPQLAFSQTERAQQFEKFRVWVQLTTGGKPYPPSLQEMFLDPMFIMMEVWPIDQPASFAALLPQNAGDRGSTTRSVQSGRGATGGGATKHEEPPDYPWEPSGGRPHPGYDVLVLNDQMNWPEETRKLAQQAVEAKRGIVVLHHALGDNQDWPWWYQEVTGGLLVLQDQQGMKKSSITPGAKLDVRAAAASHPILENVSPFTALNEDAYKGMWQSPKITPVLQTSSSANDKVIAWIGPNASSRVVCIQLGTSRETHHDPNFRMLVRNSILWTAGRLI